MGKLTIEQAKKFMEAAKNAETNPIDDKFYPESKITTADKIDTGERRPLPDKKTKKMPGKNVGKVKTLLFRPNDPNRETKLETPLLRPTTDRKTGLQYATGVNKYSKGSKKPIKAVAGVLAGLAAGVAPGVIGLGYLAKKKMKKTSAVAEPNDDKYSMNNKKPIMDLYQKTVKQNTANMYTGGEVEVTKGGDYIKDLID